MCSLPWVYSFVITFGLLYVRRSCHLLFSGHVFLYVMQCKLYGFFSLPIQLIQNQMIQPLALVSNLYNLSTVVFFLSFCTYFSLYFSQFSVVLSHFITFLIEVILIISQELIILPFTPPLNYCLIFQWFFVLILKFVDLLSVV